MKNRELAVLIYSDLKEKGADIGNACINFIERILDETEWTPAENLPPVDESNEWNKDAKISKELLCYSSEWDLRFGRYYHLSNYWTVDGIHSSNGIKVEFYREINLPKK